MIDSKPQPQPVAPKPTPPFQFGNGLLALPAGQLLSAYLRKRRHFKMPLGAPSPWYFFGIGGVFCVAFATCVAHNPARNDPRGDYIIGSLVILGFVVAGLFFTAAIWKFFKARQQFTLRTLFAFTTAVAILCSVAQFIPIAPLLIFLGVPALDWARYRSAVQAAASGDTGNTQELSR